MYDIILAHKMLSFRKGSANPSDERYLSFKIFLSSLMSIRFFFIDLFKIRRTTRMTTALAFWGRDSIG